MSEIESAVQQTERIFDFARIYEKLGMEELVYMDVEKSLKEAAMLFSDLHNVKVLNDCHGLTVLADSRLRQILYNLIDNSLKHGERVSQIRLHCKEISKDHLKLVYEDDGVGIPKAEKEKNLQRRLRKRHRIRALLNKEDVRSLRLDHPRNGQAWQRSPIHYYHTQNGRKRKN